MIKWINTDSLGKLGAFICLINIKKQRKLE